MFEIDVILREIEDNTERFYTLDIAFRVTGQVKNPDLQPRMLCVNFASPNAIKGVLESIVVNDLRHFASGLTTATRSTLFSLEEVSGHLYGYGPARLRFFFRALFPGV